MLPYWTRLSPSEFRLITPDDLTSKEKIEELSAWFTEFDDAIVLTANGRIEPVGPHQIEPDIMDEP